MRAGITYDEVRAIVEDVLLPFRFDPDSEYDLCCVQGTRISVFFRFPERHTGRQGPAGDRVNDGRPPN